MIDPMGLELFTADSIEDVRRKWEGTYIRIRHDGKEQWSPFLIGRLVSSNTNRFSLEGSVISKKGSAKSLTVDPFVEGIEVRTTYPKPTLAKVNGRMFYMYQRASRQWRLGVTDRNLGHELLLNSTYEFLDPVRTEDGVSFSAKVYHLFNPEYHGNDAFKKVWAGEDYCSPFNHEIWCGYHLRYAVPVVGLINQPIGELMSEEGEVRLFEAFDYLSKPLSKVGIRVV